jgi:hypothetical protein
MEITCRGCPKSLKSNQILKHISHSKNCESFYSEKELLEFENASKERKYAQKRKSYDPSKRARRYQESIKKAAKCDLTLKSSEITKEKYNHKEPKGDLEMYKTLVKNNNGIKCSGCNYSFKKESILKHIAKSENCKRVYNSDDMKLEFQKIKLFANPASRDRPYQSEYYKKIKHKVAEKYYLHMMVKEQGEMDEDNTNERIECKSCKRKLKVNAILNHIGNSIKCNEYYNLPSSKRKLKRLRKKCKNASKKKRSEKLAQEKAEEFDLIEKAESLKMRKRMKISLIKFKEYLKIKAKLQNENGFDKAKEKFELQFTQFKELDIATLCKNKIAELENLILDTYNMFKCDISNVAIKAEDIAKNIDLGDSSRWNGEDYDEIKNLFKPLIGCYCQKNEKFYTIEEDWHDIQLRIYLELQEIATAIGISFNLSFDCFGWAKSGVCDKCIKTNFLNSKQKMEEGTIRYENSQPISKKKKYSIPIRKRKPVNFTMEELEGTNGDDSDFEADVDTTLVTSRKIPKRKCVKNTPIPSEAFFCPGDKL